MLRRDLKDPKLPNIGSLDIHMRGPSSYALMEYRGSGGHFLCQPILDAPSFPPPFPPIFPSLSFHSNCSKSDACHLVIRFNRICNTLPGPFSFQNTSYLHSAYLLVILLPKLRFIYAPFLL